MVQTDARRQGELLILYTCENIQHTRLKEKLNFYFSQESQLQNKVYTNITQLEEYSDKAFSSPIFLLLEALGK